MVRSKTPGALSDAPRILPQIRELIETSRRHVAVAANLAMVNLYWNIGRIITQDIQKNEKRAGYGDQLVEELGRLLTQEYGQGFSARNLWDMKRFFAEFRILQAAPAESGMGREQLQPASRTSRNPQAPPADSRGPIVIDFRKHYHLGWTHYRILMAQDDIRKRVFYFEQAATQRWSTRELERKIEGALYERAALSRDTRKLVALEKKGPPEVVRNGVMEDLGAKTTCQKWGTRRLFPFWGSGHFLGVNTNPSRSGPRHPQRRGVSRLSKSFPAI